VTLTRRAADYSGGADFLLLGPAGRLRKGSAYALVVWLLNAAVVLPATGDGFAGSALMKDEALAIKIMEAVVKAVKIPVTMKMR